MDDETRLLDNHVAQLMEHFDAVQIFATKSDHNTTTSCHRGGGNVYARVGQAREWVLQQDHRVRVAVEKFDARDEA